MPDNRSPQSPQWIGGRAADPIEQYANQLIMQVGRIQSPSRMVERDLQAELDRMARAAQSILDIVNQLKARNP